MQWASAASTEPKTAAAIGEVAAVIRAELGATAPDLMVAFLSAHHRERFGEIPALVRREFGSGLLVGCSAGGVIGGGKEIEQRPGLSLTVAALPQVNLSPFYLTADNVAEWQQRIAPEPAADRHFLLLADPFTFNPEPFLSDLDRVYPAGRKIGGLASGGRQPGENALFLGPETLGGGMAGVALSGDIQVDTIVAQGCRPIGQPMFVTKCQRNLVWELDGQLAVEVLQSVYQQLDRADQELARRSLFLGVVMNEYQHEYRQGDFLIRNIVGMDAEHGVLAVGAILREGAVVQFHLRDAHTSAADLEQLLSAYAVASAGLRPAGALLFSCLGRGMDLYGEPDHDTNAFRDHLGAVPLGGFFCNGEIGPVQGSTFLHGYTSAFGLFKPRSKQSTADS
ncbi:MAG: FIST N-terminal domain-containing protein [Candidatus Binatia bacterium]|jgi:small ligand-binding sensory domain FIST